MFLQLSSNFCGWYIVETIGYKIFLRQLDFCCKKALTFLNSNSKLSPLCRAELNLFAVQPFICCFPLDSSSHDHKKFRSQSSIYGLGLHTDFEASSYVTPFTWDYPPPAPYFLALLTVLNSVLWLHQLVRLYKLCGIRQKAKETIISFSVASPFKDWFP